MWRVGLSIDQSINQSLNSNSVWRILCHFHLFNSFVKIAQFQQHVAVVPNQSWWEHRSDINVCVGAPPPVVLNSTGVDTWHWFDLSGCVARLIVSGCPPLPTQHTGAAVVVRGQEGGVSQESIKGKRGTELLSEGRRAPLFYLFELCPQNHAGLTWVSEVQLISSQILINY